jgi:hypothetical protein
VGMAAQPQVGFSEIAHAVRIARRRGSEGLNRPRRGRDPAPGRVRPMPSPGGNTTRPDRRRRQGRTSSPPAPASWDGQAADRRLRGLQLDPRVGPDGPSATGRAFRPPRRGTRRARALPRRRPALVTIQSSLGVTIRTRSGWATYHPLGSAVLGRRDDPLDSDGESFIVRGDVSCA